MKLFIKIENGQPVDHPVIEDNIKQVFPEYDEDNPPENYTAFERVSRPNVGVYQVLESDTPTYEWVGDVVKDVWALRDMTAEERQAKIDAARAQEHLNGFVFNEESCGWDCPIPQPLGDPTVWDEVLLDWVPAEE